MSECPNEIVVGVAKACKPHIYVELGVRQCKTINAVLPFVGSAIAVDKNDHARQTRATFFHCTTVEFFRRWPDTADMFYIDADHRFSAVREDFDMAASRLNKHGVIVLHDTNPIDESFTVRGCMDAYKVVDHARSSGFDVVNLPSGVAGTAIAMRNGILRFRMDG